ncbi:hypothetical protein VNO77_13656 [Canavalia gladiata]|uniref:Pectinesterase inhibitor domain-containing protein n=1 Tax=Canavalia gladiata TaxID=3824 RepID=A0AAN9QNE9_CANGL
MLRKGAEKGKRIAIIGVSNLELVAMLLAVTFNTHNGSEDDIENNKNNHVTSTVKAVQYICHPTDYKKECEESLIAEAGNTTEPKELIKIAFIVTIKKIGDKLKETNLLDEVEKEPRAKMAHPP